MTFRAQPRIRSMAILLACMLGCQQTVTLAKTQTSSSPSAVAEVPAAGQPDPDTLVGQIIKSGEFYAAARAIESAVEQDAATFSAHFDMAAVVVKALEGVEVDADFLEGLKRGFADQTSNQAFTRKLFIAVDRGGSFKLVHVHRKDRQFAALFRLTFQSNLSYLNLMLTKDEKGRIHCDDIYLSGFGELMSTTTRRTLLPAAVQAKPGLAIRLLPAESDYLQNASKLNDIRKVLKAEGFEKVRELFASLPQSMRESKMVIVQRLNLAKENDQWDEMRATADDYLRLYPGDPAIDLLCLESFIRERKFAEARAAVDRIDKLVGGDPYLNVVRTRIKDEEQRKRDE